MTMTCPRATRDEESREKKQQTDPRGEDNKENQHNLRMNIRNVHSYLFRGRLSPKLCTRQSRKVIWDMFNTLVLDTVAVEHTFIAFL